jgi:hypothetical protein
MNNKHQENGAPTGPLIFTLPASSFIVILNFELAGWEKPGSWLRQNARLGLSGSSAEDDEAFRGRALSPVTSMVPVRMTRSVLSAGRDLATHTSRWSEARPR